MLPHALDMMPASSSSAQPSNVPLPLLWRQCAPRLWLQSHPVSCCMTPVGP